ncbi:MAG: 50S ribosomal protein L29 [bacterium]
MAKKSKLKELSPGELKVKIRDFEKNLVVLRMKKKQRALKNTSEISKLKKDIARARTYLKEGDRAMEGDRS